MSKNESWKDYQGTVEESREYHDRYLKAVNNPIRRKILSILSEGEKSAGDLMDILGMKPDALAWHLKILELGFCIETTDKKTEKIYRLKKEGEIIRFLEEQEKDL